MKHMITYVHVWTIVLSRFEIVKISKSADFMLFLTKLNRCKSRNHNLVLSFPEIKDLHTLNLIMNIFI